MNVVITGGTGLVGRPLTQDFIDDGHSVTVVSRSPDRATGFPAGVSVAGWDGRTADGWGDTVDGADVVINLAGEDLAAGRWTDARKQRMWDSRVHAGQAVVAAIEAAQRKPAVVVQSSAVGYYGPQGDEDVTEASPAGDDFLAKLCVAWEEAAAPVTEHGVRLVVVRTGVVLTMAGKVLPRMSQPFKFGAGGPLGDGKQRFPWIHIADTIGATRFLIDSAAAAGPYNLTAPNPPTNAEFSTALGKALGRPSALRAPAFALKMAFGEMATVLLEGQRAQPARLLEAGYEFRFPTMEAALTDLLD